MKTRLTCIIVISLGVCEICFFILVYHSNRSLHNTLTLLNESGYTVVPNHHVLSSLKTFQAAFCGSLFLLFTAGVLVTLILCFCAVVFSSEIRSALINHSSWFFSFSGALVTTAIITMGIADGSVFLRGRDYALLSNKPGAVLNRFYYKYTLYAANTVRSPLQKQVKTCWIAPSLLKDNNNIKRLLSGFGWFPVNNRNHTDFEISSSANGNLEFRYKEKHFLSIPVQSFYDNPEFFLKQYSNKTDSAGPLRFFCAAGLFIALPVWGFALVFFMVAGITKALFPDKNTSYISGILVPAVLLSALLYINPTGRPENEKEIRRMFASGSGKTRIEALRAVCREGYDIWRFPDYCRKAANSTVTAEKYWLVNAFSISGREKSLPYVKKMVHDESINVQTAAIDALADLSCHSTTMDIFKKKVLNSRQWYVQQEAFNAMQQCRWKNNRP